MPSFYLFRMPSFKETNQSQTKNESLLNECKKIQI